MSPWFSRKPSASDAMKRAIILRCIFAKALATPPPEMLPEMMSRWNEQDRAEFIRRSQSTFHDTIRQLQDAGVWSSAEPEERRFLNATVQEFTRRQQVDASWLAEPIVCLFWALELLPELPPYDQEASHDLVKTMPDQPLKEIVKTARLRPAELIKRQRALAELWHWRARTRQLQEQGQLDGPLPGSLTIGQIVAMSALKAAERGDLAAPIGSDFPVRGKPYRDLSASEYSVVSSIAQERHRALNWLCGHSRSGRWSDTPTDT